MAAELEKAFGVQANLTTGDRGAFDVIVDGETVFSKHQMGRFPEPGEITDKLKT